MRRHLYHPYVQEMATIRLQISSFGYDDQRKLARGASRKATGLRQVLRKIYRGLGNARSVFAGEFVVVAKGSVIY